MPQFLKITQVIDFAHLALCKWAANAWPTANETAETANIDKTVFLNIGRPVMT